MNWHRTALYRLADLLDGTAERLEGWAENAPKVSLWQELTKALDFTMPEDLWSVLTEAEHARALEVQRQTARERENRAWELQFETWRYESGLRLTKP